MAKALSRAETAMAREPPTRIPGSTCYRPPSGVTQVERYFPATPQDHPNLLRRTFQKNQKLVPSARHLLPRPSPGWP